MRTYIYFLSILFMLACASNMTSQTKSDTSVIWPKSVLTFGVGQGGSSIVGVDLEFLVHDNIALQAGVGLVGYGLGFNVHFKKKLKSSFASIQYWHQGFGDEFIIGSIGPAFVYRAKKWFTFTAGLGVPVQRGKINYGSTRYNSKLREANVLIHLAIGAHMPLGNPPKK